METCHHCCKFKRYAGLVLDCSGMVQEGRAPQEPHCPYDKPGVTECDPALWVYPEPGEGGGSEPVYMQHATRARYVYDANQQRVAKHEYTVAEATGMESWLRSTYFAYDEEGRMIFERILENGKAPQTKAYVWMGKELLAMAVNGELLSVYSDHLGRPEKVFRPHGVTNLLSGSLVWQAQNHVFGRRLVMDQGVGLNIGFLGQYYDGESGLWQNWHRYYDASLGRYTQSDPIGIYVGVNTYSYVNGDPLVFVDPMGLSSRDVIVIRQRFEAIVQQMTAQGLRHPRPSVNNIKCFWGRNTNDLVGDSRLQDCGEQTDTVNDRLAAGKYDDAWDFTMDSGFGYAWGVAISRNPKDPMIWYDARSNVISVGVPCYTCSGWFGDSVRFSK